MITGPSDRSFVLRKTCTNCGQEFAFVCPVSLGRGAECPPCLAARVPPNAKGNHIVTMTNDVVSEERVVCRFCPGYLKCMTIGIS
jgi:hypothetical protein